MFFKAIAWVLLSVFGLLLLISLLLLLPPVQKWIVQETADYLENSIGTKVNVGGIYFSWPNGVSIEELYLEDQQKDTLIYAQHFYAGLDYKALLHAEIEIDDVELHNSVVNISVSGKDSLFNFDYILKAFAPTDTAPRTTVADTSAMDIDIGSIEILNTRFSYKDTLAGMKMYYSIGKLSVEIDEFDLNENSYFAEEIILENTNGEIIISKSSPPDTTLSEMPKMKVGSAQLTVSNTDFKFTNKVDKIDFSSSIGELSVSAEPIYLQAQKISLNEILLNQSKIIFKQGVQTKKQAIAHSDSKNDTAAWKINLGELEINKLSLGYRDDNTERTTNGFDPYNINAAIMHSSVSNIYFNDVDSLGAQFNTLTLREKSGLAINQLKAEIQLNPQSLELNNLLLKTEHSILQRDFAIGFSSLEKIADELHSLSMDLNIVESKIAWEDIRLLLPELAADSAMDFLRGKSIYLNSQVSGKIADLNISSFTASTTGNTKMELKGGIKGLPKINDLWVDLSLLNIQTTAGDLKKLLPANSIPSTLQMPAKIDLHANAKGSITEMNAKVKLNTSFGNLLGNFGIQSSDSTWQNASYTADVEIPSFELNRLLMDSTFGNISFNSKIQGQGLTAENVMADIDATVTQFEYSGYTYSDLLIDGKLVQQKFDGHIEMNDSNLVFEFDGEANLDSNNTEFNFILNLKAADLQHLGLHEEDVRLRGKLSADISGNSLNDISGSAELRDFLIIYNGENYPVDSLLFVSIRDSGKTNIKINSTILTGNFAGTINLADIVPSVQDHLYSYLSDDPIYDHTNESQDFKFDLKVHDEDIITDILLPDLKRFVTGDIEGSYNSKQRKLELKLYFPLINYRDLIIDSLYLVSNSDKDKMEFEINLNRFAYDTLSIKNILLTGTLANDSLISRFSISQDNEVKRFQLAAAVTDLKDEMQVKILDESIFDYQKWNVNPENLIRLGEAIIVEQLRFSKGNEYLSLQSVPANRHSHLKVEFGSFEIHNFMDIISSYQPSINRFGLEVPDTARLDSAGRKIDPSLLTGTVDGTIQLPLDSNFSILADLQIQDLKISGNKVGNIHARAKEVSSNKQEVLLALSGQDNNLKMSGAISQMADRSLLDLKIDINQLQLKSMEAFFSDHFSNSEGYLSGEATIKGNSTAPDYSGKLIFNKTAFRLQYLGSHYSIPEENISFNNSEIRVDQFTIYDSLENKFIVDGYMNIEKITNPAFKLNVKSDKFTLLNTTKEDDNDLFYGKVIVSSNMQIAGTLDKPVISSDMKMEEGSDITFIIPSTEAVTLSQEGIVEFVDKDNNLPALLMEEKSVDTVKTNILGMDLSAFIDINKETKVKIVIDPVTGDYLALQGGGKFKSTIDPAGNISLNGLYTIEEGSYELRLYNLVKRKFDIQQGSNIVWNGDPLNAEMDIRAIYTAKASPVDLLGSQTSSLSREQQGLYRQKLDFEVILMLKGKLMQPDISFKLDLEENDKGAIGGVVMAKLNEINLNSSELNKQVFALLVLRRFVSQDPFESSAGGGANVARQSVSRIMNQQLNRLTGDNIKGFQIELNIDSYEDYNMEGEQVGRTELGVALSKSLFDERVIVRVNNDFNVEGEAAQTNRAANNFAGDVSVEYLITEDGRYRINVYRDDKYAGLIEGQLIETGVSLIFTKDYQHFRDLFKKPVKTTEENTDQKSKE